jgi:hypothetical protein
MNVKYHHRRPHERGRSRRFALGLLASVGMALLLLTALYLSIPHGHTRPLDELAPTGSVGTSGTGTSSSTASGTSTTGTGSATFHEDADLRHLAPEPDPSAAAVAAY